MKRCILFLLFFSCINHFAQGQFSFNILTGRTIAWQDEVLFDPSGFGVPDNYNFEYKSINTQTFGLQLQKSANKYLDVNFEIQYALKGKQGTNVNYKEHLHYLFYSQSFDIKIWKNLKVGPGFFWGYLISQSIEDDRPNFFSSRKDWDSGPFASISYRYKRFSIRASYYYSLSEVEKLFLQQGFESNFRILTYKNRSFQIMFGYSLTKKKKKDEITID